jgi:hypothetical protein
MKSQIGIIRICDDLDMCHTIGIMDFDSGESKVYLASNSADVFVKNSSPRANYLSYIDRSFFSYRP